jgi:hypothetical protein
LTAIDLAAAARGFSIATAAGGGETTTVKLMNFKKIWVVGRGGLCLCWYL